MNNSFPMTKRGAEQLQAELDFLKKVERPKVIQAISDARALGDLKENAEYHAAREQQGFIEARIKDIEAKLSRSCIIDIKELTPSTRVVFGATVTLLHLDDNKEYRYQIVGDDEADLKHGRISISSPIARALIGKYQEDVVQVITPSGPVEYEITVVGYI